MINPLEIKLVEIKQQQYHNQAIAPEAASKKLQAQNVG